MNNLTEIVRIAFSSLFANKLRSTLTMLGIIVGIFSIISISTIISMMETSIEDGVSALGKNTFQIQKWPIVQMSSAERQRLLRNRRDIELEEFYALKESLGDNVKSIGAEMWNFGKVIKYKSEETNPNVQVCGMTPEAFPNNSWAVENGREFNYRDVHRYERVIVLGVDIADKLFPYEDPIDKEVRVDGNKLRVIGVLEKQGEFFGQSQDNFCLMPITTFQGFYGKRNRSVNITVMSYSKEDYEEVIQLSEGKFRIARGVPATEPNDFTIRTNEAVLRQISDITSGFRVGSIVIAAIALLAAGIGIMNIMLVSVTERTREIGIRKSIGARRSNILVQFLVESITLCLSGGFVGIFLGVAAGNFAGSLLEATAVVPIDWIIIGVLLCVFIGLTFGTYPAYKASNLDPIEALRYE
ncbi:MAG: ABC transporter permease [Melioribacteraceae bacterium]|nr:ABC transporter permease [Melioribacteraceae bacterium]